MPKIQLFYSMKIIQLLENSYSVRQKIDIPDSNSVFKIIETYFEDRFLTPGDMHVMEKKIYCE